MKLLEDLPVEHLQEFLEQRSEEFPEKFLKNLRRNFWKKSRWQMWKNSQKKKKISENLQDALESYFSYSSSGLLQLFWTLTAVLETKFWELLEEASQNILNNFWKNSRESLGEISWKSLWKNFPMHISTILEFWKKHLWKKIFEEKLPKKFGKNSC